MQALVSFEPRHISPGWQRLAWFQKLFFKIWFVSAIFRTT